jgi:catechol 2,3-dioxygenase-like lactoylglutathione lyase family enzyme
MFDHIGVPVTDLAGAQEFFLRALSPLGVRVLVQDADAVGLGQGDKASLWLVPAAAPAAPLHLAFMADSRAQVDAFHRQALAAGGQDNGAPGLRPRYHAHYYAAFVIGPDGHNVEVVCHKAVR